MARLQAAIRLIRDRSFASDCALAALLTVVVLGDVLASSDYLAGSKGIYVPAALLMTVPLAWRRVHPFPVVVLVMSAFAAQGAALGSTPTPDTELVPALLAVYSVGAHAERWQAYAGLAVGLVGGLVWLGPDDFLLPTVLFGGAWLAGRLVRKRQLYADALSERARVLEREREVNVRAAAAEERVRLARELHDLVGHSVSVMVVQAGAERLALGEERPETRDALLAIERTGREALAEMSRLLGILRRGDDEQLSLAPRPSLLDVEALIETVRDAGIPVELRVEGRRLRLPAGVDVSAYRIVQEALTNVVKHAGPARVSVTVRYGLRSVELEVADDGAVTAAGGAGYGLVGMRERVELHGGTFEAGQRPEGGFAVRAILPTEAVMA
jgi:signal transduction histidine kinase